MIGIIPRVLVKIITENYGNDTLYKIFDEAKIDRATNFHLNKVYSDAQWQRLLGATLNNINLNEEEVYALYANEFCLYAKNLFPEWFKMSKNSYEFLNKQPQIHNNFASSVQDNFQRKKIEDKFNIVNIEQNKKITTHYRSENRHCGLYKALANWIINDYKDTANISESKCQHKGAQYCEINIDWISING